MKEGDLRRLSVAAHAGAGLPIACGQPGLHDRSDSSVVEPRAAHMPHLTVLVDGLVNARQPGERRGERVEALVPQVRDHIVELRPAPPTSAARRAR